MKSDDRQKTFEAIPGGKELLQWFGRVPSFHDAEVLEPSLVRSGPTVLSIYTRNITNSIDANDYFIQKNHAVVTFELDGIVDLRLEGFNEQNVIWGLDLALVLTCSPLSPRL
ncbi:MAG: Imm50 family immunity protein [Pseudomonadota bacterium]